MSTCIDNVTLWMRADCLQLNASKPDLLWCSTVHQHQLPSTAVRVGSHFVQSSTSVIDLGIFNGADMSMMTQVQWTVARCFAMLRKLCSIRRSVAGDSAGNVSAGLRECHHDWNPGSLYCHLQSVLNAAAPSVASLRLRSPQTHRLVVPGTISEGLNDWSEALTVGLAV